MRATAVGLCPPLHPHGQMTSLGRLESKLVLRQLEITNKLKKIFSTSLETQEIRIILIIRTAIKYFGSVLTKGGLW